MCRCAHCGYDRTIFSGKKFGIAKAQSSQLRTQTGRVKGKLAYMAPEAVSGSRELDARSDVWAIGVILHELLTARPLAAPCRRRARYPACRRLCRPQLAQSVE